MHKDPNIPTVKFEDLCPDRCNFKDQTFERFVRRFMEKYMPGFPLGLLDTSSSEAFERWQIEPDDRYEVKRLEFTVYTCIECGEEYSEEDAKEKEYICCPLEHLAASVEGKEDEEEYEPLEKEVRTGLVLRDSHYAQDDYSESDGNLSIGVPGHGMVYGWSEDDEEDAEQSAREKNYEAMREGSYGFPWANLWAYMPDDVITDQELKDAGFVVARYCGGEGNWRQDDDYRLVGIDGGGYNMVGAHWAPLCAAVHARRNWQVETDNGPAYIDNGDE